MNHFSAFYYFSLVWLVCVNDNKAFIIVFRICLILRVNKTYPLIKTSLQCLKIWLLPTRSTLNKLREMKRVNRKNANKFITSNRLAKVFAFLIAELIPSEPLKTLTLKIKIVIKNKQLVFQILI